MDLCDTEQQKAAFSAWKKEAEQRVRIQTFKLLPNEPGTDNASWSLNLDSCPATPQPPPYTQLPQQLQAAAAVVLPQPAQEAALKERDTTECPPPPDVKPKTMRVTPAAENPLLTSPHTQS